MSSSAASWVSHRPCCPRHARTRRAPIRVACSISPVTSSFHVLPDGTKLEVLRAHNVSNVSRPPLLFIHGSYHGAWCYAEHFLPFFSALGYDAAALSLRGHAGSDAPAGDAVAGTLRSHAEDVLSVAGTLGRSPVLVGHSFGGLVVQQLLQKDVSIAGAALLCSVPPEGNGGIAKRMMFSRPGQAMRVTYAFISRAFETDAALCRDTFFSPSLPEAELRRFQAAIARNGKTRLLDLRQLNNDLPVPRPKKRVPMLVIGAELDAVVDAQAVRDTAAWVGAQPPVVIAGCGHDAMLDAAWRDTADALAAWLDTISTQQ
jgi:pimeloyl-ACP methyl ester carboxylesterase